MATVRDQISFAIEAIGHFLTGGLSIVFFSLAALFMIAVTISVYNQNQTEIGPPGTDVSQPSDKIITHDPGVHVFPTKDFPIRLAEFIDNNRQTVVVSVCPYYADAHKPGVLASQPTGYLVVTRPDPEWLKILPGSQAPPIGSQSPGQSPGR